MTFASVPFSSPLAFASALHPLRRLVAAARKDKSIVVLDEVSLEIVAEFSIARNSGSPQKGRAQGQIW